MSEFDVQIKHRDWLKFSNVEKTFKLQRENRIPSSIEGWMLVVAIKHPLRAIYGSDLSAAWALLCQALWNKLTEPYEYFNWLLHRKRWEAEYEREEMQDLVDEFTEGATQ